MSKMSRNIWLRTVKAYPADFFSPAQYGLLRAYCEAEAAHKTACSDIRKNGQCISNPVSGAIKRNPMCAERDANAQIMASLGTKLKLNDRQKPKSKPKSKREGLLFKG